LIAAQGFIDKAPREEQVTTSRHCRLANGVAVIGMSFSALITISAGAPATTSGQRLFAAMVVGWACVPYLATALSCYLIHKPKWRSVLSFGLVGYAIVDGYVRVQSLYLATGSTDSLVVLFLPVMSPAVVLIVGGVSAAVISVLHRPSGRWP
jgi:hypothetical protein